jgi:hypothetical protein
MIFSSLDDTFGVARKESAGNAKKGKKPRAEPLHQMIFSSPDETGR